MTESCRLRRDEGYGTCADDTPRRAHGTLQPLG